MTTTNPLTTLWGKITRVPTMKRGQQQNHRFLCPNCLHFGDFAFVCCRCWIELPGYAKGKISQTCPHCQRSLLSADGDGVRAYCKHCKGNCERAIYHQRQVRVLATLRTADSQSLYQSISGQEYHLQSGEGYIYDDGERLAYVLNLSSFVNKVHSFPQTHALREANSIWLDASASNPKKLALELEDRFTEKAGQTELPWQTMTVCVQQPEVNSSVKPVLETRFGEVVVVKLSGMVDTNSYD